MNENEPDRPASSLHPTSRGAEDSLNVTRELLIELRAAREAAQQQHLDLARERRRERRWKTVSQLLIFGLPMIAAIFYGAFIANALGLGAGPAGPVIGMVTIDGPIGSEERASAGRVIAAARKAFESREVKAVVLSIDSPGGAPVEAERIADAIVALKRQHSKPVIAVINGLGASAAYMVATHADKIYAGKYSLVGSVGAVMTAWDLHKGLQRLDVSQRVYASGHLKSLLNPFSPITAEADEKASTLVRQLGKAFTAEVRATRGDKLQPGVDYGTGEVWGGQEALAIGLIDEIGTLDDVVKSNWDLEMHDFGPGKNDLGPFSSLVDSFAGALVRSIRAQMVPRWE